MNLETLLADRLAVAFAAVAGVPVDPAVRASQHADFQSGAALALARRLGRPPREIAAEVVAKADLFGLATAAVSGPGFVNLTVADYLLTAAVAAMDDDRLGVPRAATPERVVVDYSSPNVAKQLQVGHLRSTVIGDALARMLDWLGHDVVRVNHLGDWGTKFGLLIEHLMEHGGAGDLTDLYREAYARFTADGDFATRARLRVVALQNGDEPTRAWWRRLVAQTTRDLAATYARLGVSLTTADIAGESFYQDKLASVVAELVDKGLLVESEGALCAFPPASPAPPGCSMWSVRRSGPTSRWFSRWPGMPAG